MNRKQIFASIVVVGFLAVGGFAYRSAVENKRYYQIHQPTRAGAVPRLLYSIGGKRMANIGKPMGIFVQNGRLYITSSDNRVVTMDRDGSKPRSFQLGAAEQTRSLRAVAVDDGGRIYVSTGRGQGIFVLDSKGKPEKNPFKFEQLKDPVGLAFHSDRLYVTDVGDHTVKIYTRGGKLVKKIGGPGNTAGRFQYPNGVSVARDGTIYVADSNNSRVQVFDKNYRFVELLPQPADANDRMFLPRSVAIDKLGRIHVVDTLRGLVHVYDAEHRHLFIYGQNGKNETILAYPNGACIDNDTGLIFIADRLNNRIAVWAEK